MNAAECDSSREHGLVAWFDDRLGVGCIKTPMNENIYFRYSDIDMPGHRIVLENSPISFARELTDKRLRARSIRPVGFPNPPWQQAKSRLARFFLRWMHRTGRVRYMWVVKYGVPTVNLVRYYLAFTSFFEIYLHQFLEDDEPVLHDHPWSFLSILLRGSYEEEGLAARLVRRTPGSILWRRRNYLHRVRLADIKKGITFSLIITGPRRYPWQFYDPRTERSLAPTEYGNERGAPVLLFKDLQIRGHIFPHVSGGTTVPRALKRNK